MLVHSIMLSSDSLVQLSYIIKYYMILSFDHIESYAAYCGKLRIEWVLAIIQWSGFTFFPIRLSITNTNA